MRVAPRALPATALLLLLSATPAQTPQPPSATAATTIHVYSRETIVDVLVTDDKGQPVRGLTRDDFTVEEDGHRQPIRGFSEYDKATPPAPVRALPANTYTNDTTLPTNGPVQIIIFDLLGTPPAEMVRSKKYVADYLRTMPAGTQVALFEFSPRKGLALLQGFTSDARAASAAVDNLDAEWIHDPVVGESIAMAGLNQIAAYVASIHGRKNLIWLVPHVPLSITRDGGYASPCQSSPPPLTLVHQLMDLYDIFTREQIAIYPFDPRGVHVFDCHTLIDAAVAEGTGGDLSNSNDYASSIANIVDSTSHFYTLSYVPSRTQEDGHYHPIAIRVDRPGLHLNYRNGYNDEQPDPPSAALLHDMIQGPMRLGAIPATQILFDLHVEPASPHAQAATPVSTPTPPHTKGVPYSTLFTFDPTQIALTESPDGTRTANIELDLGAFDFYGKLVTARSQTFKLTVTSAQYSGFYRRPIQFDLPIDLPRGKLTLHAGIFDTTTFHAGTLEIPLTVPKN
jgi:VWFA-related protein